jgi:hypothetical protein
MAYFETVKIIMAYFHLTLLSKIQQYPMYILGAMDETLSQ